MKKLTFKQSVLLAFIIEWHRSKGVLPTMGDAARVLGVSETAIRMRLAYLVQAGYVEQRGTHRATLPVRDLDGNWIGPALEAERAAGR